MLCWLKNAVAIFGVLFLLTSWQTQELKVNSRDDFDKVNMKREQLQKQFADSNVFIISDSYLKSFMNARVWATKNGTEKEKNLADYNILFYHYNHQDSDKVISIANALLSRPNFMEMKESVRTLEALNSSYNRKGFYNRQLDVLPILIAQNEKFDYYVFQPEYSDSYEVGMIYYNLNQFSRARQNFEIQAELFKDNNRNFMYASMMNNIALTYEGEKDFNNAVEKFQEASRIVDESMDEENPYFNREYKGHFKNVIESNIASIRLKQGELAQLEPVFLKELKSSQLVGEPRITIQCYLHLSKLSMLQNDVSQALRYNDSALSLEREFKNPSIRANILSVRSSIFLMQNKVAESYDLELRSDDIKDSLISIATQRNMEEASLNYDFVKARKEIAEANLLLQEKNKIEWMQWIILGISTILIITFITLFIRTRKARKLSEEQSRKLKIAADEKELMLYEIHHRIKNNLQTVSGILDLKTSQLSNPEFTAAINESQQLIQTMNMVHDQLYEYGEDTIVDMQEHFVNICQGITSQHTDKEISLHVSSRDVVIPTRDAIPLGLILCELVTNSMKHGFNKKNTGRITVFLKKELAQYIFKYKDNGSATEKNVEDQSNSVGLNLIAMLVEELDGKMETSFQQGFKFEMKF
ncbi:Two-component sensor histidine kinase, contains HisKA and HATPase domains [Nonlabens sp. Hel1_33_55]|nr:Two-component sensor histidine kinase, contains HisKA and HATPase domains [Nonlabens sp. Hel1_33_55]